MSISKGRVIVPIRRSLVILVLLPILGTAFYIASKSAYHSYKFPISVDNMIVDTGMWRVFGTRDLVPYEENGFTYAIKPQYSIVEGTDLSIVVRGYVDEIDYEGNRVTNLVLRRMGEDPLVFEEDVEVQSVNLIVRGLYFKKYDVGLPVGIAEVKVGDLVECEIYSVDGGNWNISYLNIMRGE